MLAVKHVEFRENVWPSRRSLMWRSTLVSNFSLAAHYEDETGSGLNRIAL